MSVSNATATVSKPLPSAAVDTHAGEVELAMFSLRDTLSGITVREANFGEFLAALKKFGVQAGKPS